MSTATILHRHDANQTAIVFLHGFTGKAASTWGAFPQYLMDDPRLASWDIASVGFPSSFAFDLPGLWAADPDLSLLAQGLGTTLALEPFRDYKALVLIAHSMGGLIAQRALLDTPSLAKRVGHLFLFGTPSGGLVKARFGRWWKRQIRDMASDGAFVTGLERDRQAWFQGPPPFALRAVAGNRDEFVPASSSLQPFPRECWAVVDGNHLEIVKPDSPDHKSVQLVKTSLVEGSAPVVADSAMVAIEQRHFQEVVDTLLPQAERLDDIALVNLALALDGLGRGAEALELLERLGRSATDAMGVLAGRLKRRWLVERDQADWQRAYHLYSQALALSEQRPDHEQSFYHAINLAFLELMMSQDDTPVPDSAQDMARKALDHCEAAADTMWRRATEGEALLILNDRETAFIRYAWAINRVRSPRELGSMYSQALRVAGRVYGEDGARDVAALFTPKEPE